MAAARKKGDKRTRQVLEAVVRAYVRDARPVSSSQIARELGARVSSATVRNEMARLEESGLLAKPHTSAGRVPTEAGYRSFVRSLELAPTLPPAQRDYIIECLLAARKDSDILQAGSHLLTELTRLIGIALLPGLGKACLAHMEFIPLGEKKVMLLLVLQGEQVRRKVLRHRYRLAREELRRLSAFVMAQLGGLSLREAHARLEKIMAQGGDLPMRLVSVRYLCDGLGQMLGELSGGVAGEAPLVYSHGWSDVVQPEFGDAEFTRRVFRAVNDRAVMARLATRGLEGQGVRVLIGDDGLVPEMKGCSLVSASCASEESGSGSLAVVGPLRMDYEHIIPLVEFTSQVISGKARKPEES